MLSLAPLVPVTRLYRHQAASPSPEKVAGNPVDNQVVELLTATRERAFSSYPSELDGLPDHGRSGENHENRRTY